MPLLLLAACARGPMIAPLRYDPVPPALEEPFRAVVPEASAVTPTIALRWETSALPNGLRLAVLPRRALPIVSVRLVFERGSADAQARVDLAGVFARMLDNGSADRPGEALAAAYARLGAPHRTFLGDDACGISARGSAADAEELIALAAERALRPRLTEVDFAGMRARWLQEASNSTYDGEEMVNRNALASVFGALHPYGFARPAARDTQALRLADAARLYGRLFRPEHALLVVVGDVQAAEVRGAAERAFGSWAPAAADDAPRAVVPEPFGTPVPLIFVERRDSDQVDAAVVARGPAPSAEDFPALEVLARTLGGLSSRLRGEVRVESGASYDFNALVLSMRAHSMIALRGAFDAQKAVPALRSMLVALADARTRDVPEAELERAKASLVSELRTQVGTTEGLAGTAVAAFARGMPLSAAADYPARIQAVTPEHVRRAAQRWLGARSLSVVVVGGARVGKSLPELGLGAPQRRDPWADAGKP
jgi:predicted Zn-dependent peptidase